MLLEQVFCLNVDIVCEVFGTDNFTNLIKGA